MSEETRTVQANTSLPEQWTDIFYGVLAAPRQTMEVLADASRYRHDGLALLASIFTVWLGFLLSGLSKTGLSVSLGSQFRIMVVLGSGFCCWIILSALIFVIGKLARTERESFAGCLVVTGWTFLPFIFSPVAYCLSKIILVGALFQMFLTIWFLYLQWTAASAILAFDSKRMAALVLIVPLLFFLIYVSSLILSFALSV